MTEYLGAGFGEQGWGNTPEADGAERREVSHMGRQNGPDEKGDGSVEDVEVLCHGASSKAS
jgi:hypothetical protein